MLPRSSLDNPPRQIQHRRLSPDYHTHHPNGHHIHQCKSAAFCNEGCPSLIYLHPWSVPASASGRSSPPSGQIIPSRGRPLLYSSSPLLYSGNPLLYAIRPFLYWDKLVTCHYPGTTLCKKRASARPFQQPCHANPHNSTILIYTYIILPGCCQPNIHEISG